MISICIWLKDRFFYNHTINFDFAHFENSSASAFFEIKPWRARGACSLKLPCCQQPRLRFYAGDKMKIWCFLVFNAYNRYDQMRVRCRRYLGTTSLDVGMHVWVHIF